MRRRERCPVSVAPGERVLAWSHTDRGDVAGTAQALYLPDRRVPWEEVESASWDEDALTWHVSEVGRWGEPRAVHAFVVEEPSRFLRLARERITASVVLQRFESLPGGGGFSVVVRRPPTGTAAPAILVEYDDGIDPDDPLVRDRVDAVVAEVGTDLGLG